MIFPNYRDEYYMSPYEYEQQRRHRAFQQALRRRRVEEELLRRQEEEELQRQRMIRQQELRRRQEAALREEARRQTDSDRYQIVRGPDGNLYRVDVLQRPRQEPKEAFEYIQGPNGVIYNVPGGYVGDSEPEPKLTSYLRARAQPKPQRYRTRDEKRVVRGSDGRLYHVEPMSESECESESSVDEDVEPRVVRGRDGSLYLVRPNVTMSETKAATRYPSVKKFSVLPTAKPLDASAKQASSGSAQAKKIDKARRSSLRKKISIVVEDASDSENEDDMTSVWRHRVPGPGESWMEPTNFQRVQM